MKTNNSFSFRRTAQALFLALLVIPYFSACKKDDNNTSEDDIPPKSDKKEMTDVNVRVGTEDFVPVLQDDGKTWFFEIPYGFDEALLEMAIVTFSLSQEATASPGSGSMLDLSTPKDIVVKAQDESTFTYTIASTRYYITATTLSPFGILFENYAEAPSARIVTVTNHSMGAITLEQPVAVNYNISNLSSTNLAPGATATFTVRPKLELPAGLYNETIAITGSNDVSASVEASFMVIEPGLAFNGPHILSAARPYDLEAVDFDFGGQDVGFFSSDYTNSGSEAGKQYRIDGGCDLSSMVDISEGLYIFSGNHSLQWHYDGEDWFQYTVAVQNAGTYSVSIYAHVMHISSYRIFVNDVDVTDELTVGLFDSNWGGDFEWVEMTTLELEQGVNRIKINWVNAFVDFKTFRFTYQP